MRVKKLRNQLRLAAKRSQALFFLPTLLAGCAPLGLLDVIVPDGNYKRQSDIAYGDHPRLKLDVYHSDIGRRDAPIVVFFYGGSWKSGSRGKYRFVGDALTNLGYTVVIPDYRLYPEVRFPAFVEDAALAVRWVYDNIAKSGNSTRPVFLAGHSAGAHIAALLAVDASYFQSQSLGPQNLCGVIGLAGPYTFDPLRYPNTRKVFEGLNDRDYARPSARITGVSPPFLLLHGANDRTVNAANTLDFARKLEEKGNTVKKVLFPELGHYRIILAVSRPFDDIAPVNNEISDFIERHRGCGNS